MTSLYGGYGQAAYGRTQCGSPPPESKDVIEPRFSFSYPRDGARNQRVDRWAVFEVYYFGSSYPGPVDHAHWGKTLAVIVEVSLDGGVTFMTIFDPITIPDPGACPTLCDYRTRVRSMGGQRVRILVQKISGWPSNSHIVFRYTGPDEFGQPATKNPPVKWGNYVV